MGIARITLYHYPATRSARVKWLLHELLGEAFDTVRVQLYDGEQYGRAYLALNPNHAVPAVRIDMVDGRSVTMLESGAIITMLADAYAEKGLAPPPSPFSLARVDYLQMLHFCGATIDMMLWQIRVNLHILPAAEQHATTVDRYKAKIAKEVEPQMRVRLAAAPFICGETFSAADCMFGHAVMWARSYGLCRDREFRAYLALLAQRPAFVQAFADAKDFDPKGLKDTSVQAQFTG